MMIGVTSAEAFVLLNSVEMELGLESETRNKLVSDLVTWSPSLLCIYTCVAGDGELQPPREGDLLCGDHGVHGLGQRGQAPSHHQAATTPAPWIHTVRSAAYGYLMI